jgi:peptidoglycan/LPS O-acetylase OafA/YrhL
VLESINVSNISIFLFTISFLFLPLYSGSQPEALGYIIMMLFTSAGIYRILNLRKIFIFLGKYSYFIYFCHFQVLYVFYRLINQYNLTLAYKFSYPVALILLLCITLVVTGFFAILSFRLIEDPILRRRKN